METNNQYIIYLRQQKQSNEELPIWLSCNELRYVSGVTKTTTCYEIIKALIDDELCNGNDNGNAQFYNTENNINNNIANNKLGEFVFLFIKCPETLRDLNYKIPI